MSFLWGFLIVDLFQVRGCYYHRWQALRRHLNAKQLLWMATSCGELQQLLNLVYGLPFLPPDKVS